MRIFLFAVLIAFFSSPVRAVADAPPVPARKMDMKAIQKNLDFEKNREQALEGKLKDLRKELDKTREEMTAIAAQARKNEDNLLAIEKRIEGLETEKQELEDRLEDDYGSIADLILALERMRRIPPETLIVRPGAPLETAQSAMLLQSTLPAINKRTEQLSNDLSRLETLSKNLETERQQALRIKKELEEKQTSISRLSEKREALYGKTESDYENTKQVVSRLSKESRTLMELIGKLDKEKSRRESQGQKLVMPVAGRPQLPVGGTIIEVFGKPNAIGAVNRGVTIETRPGSLVTAPMGGIIRFTGQFKNYGNMVIVEHDGGYHSLIAGLHRIDTQVNSRVKVGEPIGQVPLTSSRGGRPALYYELRHKGQPVDPAQKFTDLKS